MVVTKMEQLASGGAAIRGNFARTIAILIGTIPESLPPGALILSALFMDAPLGVFAGGLLLTYLIALFVFQHKSDVCSPWAAAAPESTAGAGIAGLAVIAFAATYIGAASWLLKDSFDQRVAAYSAGTVPAVLISCTAIFAAYLLFRAITGCDTLAKIVLASFLGIGLAALEIVAIYFTNQDYLNIVHIPRGTPGTAGSPVVLCAVSSH